MDRKTMKELANKRIIGYDSTPSKQEPTGAQFLKVLLDEPEKSFSQKKHIVLYLKEGLNCAEKNFTKYPNDIFKVMHDHLKKESESLLYVYLWRESWGYGRNYCRLGYAKIVKGTVIGCEKTVKRAISSLIEQRFVVRAIDINGETDFNIDGSLYRVLTPKEIMDKTTEEGVLLDDIPIEGVVMVKDSMDKFTMDKKSTGKNVQRTKSPDRQFVQDGIDNLSRDKLSIPDVSTYEIRENVDGGQNVYGQNVPPTMDSITILDANQDAVTVSGDYGNKYYSNKVHHIKDSIKDNIKDSLTLDQIVLLFYNGIGQTRISQRKRERAKKCFEELIQDGFSQEDIVFAVNWTIKNAKEKPYDFSLIKDTIGQAMAQKDKTQKEQKLQVEKEISKTQKEEQLEEQAKERENIIAIKQNLSITERSELRYRALEDIKKIKGIKEEFITEILIEAKENEIIRQELSANE